MELEPGLLGMSDTVTRTHSTWLHLVKSPRYFSAVDEVREDATTPASGDKGYANASGNGVTHRSFNANAFNNPLGKLPGSVWTMTEQEAVERIVKGWAPTHGICTACGEGRRPVVAKEQRVTQRSITATYKAPDDGTERWHNGRETYFNDRTASEATITSYACACPDATAPVSEAVVIDPFSTTRPR